MQCSGETGNQRAPTALNQPPPALNRRRTLTSTCARGCFPPDNAATCRWPRVIRHVPRRHHERYPVGRMPLAELSVLCCAAIMLCSTVLVMREALEGLASGLAGGQWAHGLCIDCVAVGLRDDSREAGRRQGDERQACTYRSRHKQGSNEQSALS